MSLCLLGRSYTCTTSEQSLLNDLSKNRGPLLLLKVVRQLIRSSIQLPVGQLLLFIDQRNRVQRPFNLSLKTIDGYGGFGDIPPACCSTLSIIDDLQPPSAGAILKFVAEDWPQSLLARSENAPASEGRVIGSRKNGKQACFRVPRPSTNSSHPERKDKRVCVDYAMT